MTKFLATQVSEEVQTSDFDPEEFEKGGMYENILITGNPDYKPVGVLQKTLDLWNQYQDDIEEAINNKDMKTLKNLFPNGSNVLLSYNIAFESQDRLKILAAVVDDQYQEWDFDGCVQSEWQYLYTPADGTWTSDKVLDLAARYWNTGSEWEIEVTPDLLGEPESDGVTTVDVYTTAYDDEDIREDIAERLYEAGVDRDIADADNVYLQKFAGYNREPVYEDIQDPYIAETVGKKEFVEKLGDLFAEYGVSQVHKMEYVKKHPGETVYITDGDGRYPVDVTGDSDLAIAYDVIKGIWNH